MHCADIELLKTVWLSDEGNFARMAFILPALEARYAPEKTKKKGKE